MPAPRRLSYALSTLAVLACAGAARAEDPQAPGLNWVRLRGAEACISAPELAQRVEMRTGRMIFASVSEAGVFVDGYVAAAGDGWDVTLEVSDRQGVLLGRRELHFGGEACSVVDEAVTLVIAVTLHPNTALLDAGIALDPATTAKLKALFGAEPVDPDPATLAPAPAQLTGPAPMAKPLRSRASERGAAPETDPSRQHGTFSIGTDAVGIAGFGQLPGFALGAGLRVVVRPPDAFPIEVGASLLPPVDERAGGVPGQARFFLLLGSLSACPIEPAWLRASAVCAGAEIGQLEVEATGFAEDNRSLTDVLANVLVSAVYRPEIVAGLHLRVAAALAVPLIQRSYSFEALDGSDTALFRMPQLAGRLELGLALQL